MYYLYVKQDGEWVWRAKSEKPAGLKDTIENLEASGLDRSRDLLVSFGRASDSGLEAREEEEE